MAAAKIGIAVAIIALMLGGFAFVRASAPEVTSTLNGLAGVLTLAHFSSLNMSTSGNTITLGIDLTHANIWTAIQSNTLAWDVKASAGDANPCSRLGQDNFGALFMGQCGTHALDMEIVWSSTAQLDIKPSVSNESPTVRFAASGSGTNPRFDFYHGQAAANVEFASVGWGLTGSDFSIKESQNGGTLQDFEINMGGTQMMIFHSNAADVTPGSDNTINIGTNSLRFKLVRAVTITSGDLNFWPNPCQKAGQVGCSNSPLYTLTEDLTGKGLIFVNHVTGQNQTMAMLNSNGSPTPQFQQAVNSAIAASPYTVTQTVTTTTTVTKIGP